MRSPRSAFIEETRSESECGPGCDPVKLVAINSHRLSTFRVALVTCVLAVAWLAFAPLEQAPGVSWDKGNHVFAFFFMAWLADEAFPGPDKALRRWSLLLTYGLVIELVQRELPYRHFSWLDLVADSVGIILYSFGRDRLGRLLPALGRCACARPLPSAPDPEAPGR